MNNDEVLVIGHRNPDIDSICSAIGYADYKIRTGMASARAARCGDLNERIEFVLAAFSTPAPKLVSDVSPTVLDLMQPEMVFLGPGATLIEALELMDERNIRALPILRDDGSCLGFASIFKMNKLLSPISGGLFDGRRARVSASNLARTLKTSAPAGVAIEEEFIMVIAGRDRLAFQRRLETLKGENLLLIVDGEAGMLDWSSVNAASIAVLIGTNPDSETMSSGRARGITFLESRYDVATTAVLCCASTSIEHLAHEKFLSFHERDLIEDIQAQAASSPYQMFPVLDARSRVTGVLTKSDFLKKVRRQLILVDHNELSQAVAGADQVEILEIIDHHRFSASTRHPILIRNEPVGSTSTIVAECFFKDGLEVSRQLGGLLLAGVISDTLNLTSPTTSERDHVALRRLEKIAGVSGDEFTRKLFASSSVLASKPAGEAILEDCKEFNEQGRRFSAAQIEELGLERFWEKQEDISDALDGYRQAKGYFFSVLLITDVPKQSSLLLISGAPSLLKQIDLREVQPGLYECPGFVSRKKQLLPYLIQCLERLGSPRPIHEPVTMV